MRPETANFGKGTERSVPFRSNALMERAERGLKRGGQFCLSPSFKQRQEAHQLLDRLPAEKLTAVRSLLEVLVRSDDLPLTRSLALTPVEEEEITSETAAALERACASLARGEGVPHEEILREFGLTK